MQFAAAEFSRPALRTHRGEPQVVLRGDAASLVDDPELTTELLGVAMRRDGAA